MSPRRLLILYAIISISVDTLIAKPNKRSPAAAAQLPYSCDRSRVMLRHKIDDFIHG